MKTKLLTQEIMPGKTLDKRKFVPALLGVFLLVGPVVYAESPPADNQTQPVVQATQTVTDSQVSEQAITLDNQMAAPQVKREMIPVYYSQNDDRWREYKYSMYGEPTWRTVYEGGPQNIGRSGCAVTNVAMALSSLTGQEITPPIVGDYSVEHGFRTYGDGTSSALIPDIANYYGVDCYTTSNLTEVIDTLKNNKNCVVLTSMYKNSHFTCHGHFLMITGATLRDDGYNWFTIYDSNTYSRPDGPDGELYVDNPNYTAWRPTSQIELTDQTGIINARARLVNGERNSAYYILSIQQQ